MTVATWNAFCMLCCFYMGANPRRYSSFYHPPQENIPHVGREHRARGDKICPARRTGGLVGILYISLEAVFVTDCYHLRLE